MHSPPAPVFAGRTAEVDRLGRSVVSLGDQVDEAPKRELENATPAKRVAPVQLTRDQSCVGLDPYQRALPVTVEVLPQHGAGQPGTMAVD